MVVLGKRQETNNTHASDSAMALFEPFMAQRDLEWVRENRHIYANRMG